MQPPTSCLEWAVRRHGRWQSDGHSLFRANGAPRRSFVPNRRGSLFWRSFWSPEPQLNAAETLADIVRGMISSPERRRELGYFGRDFALKTFSLEAMARLLASVYEHSLSYYGPLAWLQDLNREVPDLARSVRRRMNPARYRPVAKAAV